MSHWPYARSSALREAVGQAYRKAGGRGADEQGRIGAAVEAFLDAGGVAASPRRTVQSIIRDIAWDRREWLLELAEERALRRHRRPQDTRLRWRRRAMAALRACPCR